MQVIYDLIDDVKAAMEGKLRTVEEKVPLGTVSEACDLLSLCVCCVHTQKFASVLVERVGHTCAHAETKHYAYALSILHICVCFLQAEVKAVFGSGKTKVAGCIVTEGKLQRAFVTVKRGKQVCVWCD